MTKFKKAHPILFAIIISYGYVLVMDVFGRLSGLLPETPFVSAASEIFQMLIAIAFVCLSGYFWIYKRRKGFFKSVVAGAILFALQIFSFVVTLYQALSSDTTQWVSVGGIIVGIIGLIGVGLREESIYRGIVTNVLAEKYCQTSKGVFFTVFLSGLLFGSIHLTNVFVGVNFLSAVVQTCVAAGLGWVLAAIYLRCGNIWALILLHCLTDSASLFYGTFTHAMNQKDVVNQFGIGNFSPLLIMIPIALFLLRKSKREQIIERFRSLANSSSDQPEAK